MTKKVKIINPVTAEAVEITTEATIWAELEQELLKTPSFKDVNFETYKVFMKDSSIKKTLGLPGDTLSDETSFKIFISPINMKGGMDKKVLEELRDAINEIFDAYIDECFTNIKTSEITNEDRKDFFDMFSIE